MIEADPPTGGVLTVEEAADLLNAAPPEASDLGSGEAAPSTATEVEGSPEALAVQARRQAEAEGADAMARQLAERLPQAVAAFRSRWEGFDWSAIPPEEAARLQAQMGAERKQLGEISAAHGETARRVRVAHVAAEAAKLSGTPLEDVAMRGQVAAYLRRKSTRSPGTAAQASARWPAQSLRPGRGPRCRFALAVTSPQARRAGFWEQMATWLIGEEAPPWAWASGASCPQSGDPQPRSWTTGHRYIRQRLRLRRRCVPRHLGGSTASLTRLSSRRVLTQQGFDTGTTRKPQRLC